MPAQSELAAQDEVRLGHRAAELLADPILADAFLRMEDQIITAWKVSQDPLERELLHRRCIALKALKSELEILVGRGEWAEKAIKTTARREKFGETL
jgi:hypothetical protein